MGGSLMRWSQASSPTSLSIARARWTTRRFSKRRPKSWASRNEYKYECECGYEYNYEYEYEYYPYEHALRISMTHDVNEQEVEEQSGGKIFARSRLTYKVVLGSLLFV